AFFAGRGGGEKSATRRVLISPPFVSLVVGIAAGLIGGWPQPVDAIFDRLGATLVPIALFSVGLQFRLQFQHGQAAAVLLALGWKLALAPLVILLAGLAIGVSGAILTIA